MILNGQIWNLAIAALLSVFGELAHLLNKKNNKAFKITNMVSRCFVATFSGTIAYFISSYFGYDLNLTFIIAGVCGWIGPQILDSISSMVTKKIGLAIET